MTANFDVIIIGGGMLGLSTAYHLARHGAQTLLLQAGDIGGGSSTACAGRAQVAEGKLDPFNLTVIRDGFKKLETLEQVLGQSFEYRKNGLLVLINSQQHWDLWSERAENPHGSRNPYRDVGFSCFTGRRTAFEYVGILGSSPGRGRLAQPVSLLLGIRHRC